MRKSLGNKRNEIGADQIAEITRLYGAFEENERVKILPNESFGFQRITVERPLRLRYEVTEATLPAVESVVGLDEADPRRSAWLLRDRWRSKGSHRQTEPRSPDGSARCRRPSRRRSGTRSRCATPRRRSSPTARAIQSPTPNCATTRTSRCPEPVEGSTRTRPALASQPYRRAVDAYMAAEVLPFVPDAWVDHAKTKIGYEIPLTRQFYRYVPPRPSRRSTRRSRALEEEIQGLLRGVSS